MIGKSVTMLLNSDQLSLLYGNTHSQPQNIQQILILVRILTQIGEFYLRHDKLADAEMCCQEIYSLHPISYLHIYLVKILIITFRIYACSYYFQYQF